MRAPRAIAAAVALSALLALAVRAETRAAALFAAQVAPPQQLLAAALLVAALAAFGAGVEGLRRRAGLRPWSWYGCAVLSAALTFGGAALHVGALRDTGPAALYGIVALVARPALRAALSPRRAS